MIPRRHMLSLGLCAALAALAACRRESAPDSPASPLSAVLSTNSIHVGELAQLRLTANHPADTRVEWPDLNRGDDIIVRDQRAAPDSRPGHTVTLISLTSLSITNHIISTNLVRFVRADGAVSGEEPFPFLTLDVQSLLTGSNTAPRDIKGLAEWPANLSHRMLKVFGGVALLALLAGLIALWIRRRQKQAAIPALPPAAHEIALRALEALVARNYIETENAEPFYVELSAIVRTYLEQRFSLRAPELTTEEFIREAASSRRLSLDHQQLTLAFLEQSDLVKFAKHRPTSADMRAGLNAAERLVRETIPPPALQQEAP